MTTTPHLSTNNSKTSNFKLEEAWRSPYSKHGWHNWSSEASPQFIATVPQFPRNKNGRFLALSWPVHSLKTAQLLKGGYPSVSIQWLCPCLPFVVVALTQCHSVECLPLCTSPDAILWWIMSPLGHYPPVNSVPPTPQWILSPGAYEFVV